MHLTGSIKAEKSTHSTIAPLFDRVLSGDNAVNYKFIPKIFGDERKKQKTKWIHATRFAFNIMNGSEVKATREEKTVECERKTQTWRHFLSILILFVGEVLPEKKQ